MKDLFKNPELLPTELQTLLNNFASQENDYSTCANLLKECEAIGYTFEYGLDAEPFNLRVQTLREVTGLNSMPDKQVFKHTQFDNRYSGPEFKGDQR